jgi:hypothetical protein
MSDPRYPLPLLLTASLAAGSVAAGDVSGLDLSVHPDDITPAVTLREHENRIVEEYRVNNQLYMVKVTPSVGAPYYLVDDDGSGDMAWHRGSSRVEQSVPQWTLMSW